MCVVGMGRVLVGEYRNTPLCDRIERMPRLMIIIMIMIVYCTLVELKLTARKCP